MKITIDDEKKLGSVAEQTLQKLIQKNGEGAGVIALYGELGSGKTTFTKELAQFLQIKETVNSPTFVILKIFEIPQDAPVRSTYKKLIHVDTYRLDLPEELERLGFKEMLNNKENLVVIEWPEIVEDMLPTNRENIKFKFVNHTTRELELSD